MALTVVAAAEAAAAAGAALAGAEEPEMEMDLEAGADDDTAGVWEEEGPPMFNLIDGAGGRCGLRFFAGCSWGDGRRGTSTTNV